MFDVTGYFLADDSGATFTPGHAPVRVLDTRLGHRAERQVPRATRRGRSSSADDVAVPATAIAITGNLTVVGPTKAGYASVTKDPTATPTTSTINFPAGANRANGVFAPLNASARAVDRLQERRPGRTADIMLDITGYFEAGVGGLQFVPLNPSRIMDTRPTAVLSGLTRQVHREHAEDARRRWSLGRAGRCAGGHRQPDGDRPDGRRLRVGDARSDRTPPTSTINFPLGDTMANGLVAPLNGSGDELVRVQGRRREEDRPHPRPVGLLRVAAARRSSPDDSR